MKIIIKILAILTLWMIVMAIPALADAPPDPGGDPNTGGGTPVGGTPLGGGLMAMAIYGMLYAIARMKVLFRK